jgi:hypothetical protein
MRFLDCYLPYFSQWLITCPLSAHLPFQPLFTETLHAGQLLATPLFSSAHRAPHPLCFMFIFSSLFTIQFLFCFVLFAGQGVSLSKGLCWFIPGVTVGMPHANYLPPVGLLYVSPGGLEPLSISIGTLLFSQCIMVQRNFVQAGGSGFLWETLRTPKASWKKVESLYLLGNGPKREFNSPRGQLLNSPVLSLHWTRKTQSQEHDVLHLGS